MKLSWRLDSICNCLPFSKMLPLKYFFSGSLLLGLSFGQSQLVQAKETKSSEQGAQDAQLAEARKWFREGIELEAAGDFKAALKKFEAVAEVKLSPQVRFHLARCHESLGFLTQALGQYRLASFEAEEQKLPNQEEFRQSLESLEASIPSLLIHSSEQGTLSLDGVELDSSSLDIAKVIDPGRHQVVLLLPGGHRVEESIELSRGEHRELSLQAPDGWVAPVAGTSAAKDEASAADATLNDPSESSSMTLPIVFGGVSLAAFVGAGIMAWQGQEALSRLESECIGDICPTSAQSDYDLAQAMSIAAPITLGVGILSLGASIYLFSTSSSSESKTSAKIKVTDPVRLAKGGASEPSVDAVDDSNSQIQSAIVFQSGPTFTGVQMRGSF